MRAALLFSSLFSEPDSSKLTLGNDVPGKERNVTSEDTDVKREADDVTVASENNVTVDWGEKNTKMERRRLLVVSAVAVAVSLLL